MPRPALAVVHADPLSHPTEALLLTVAPETPFSPPLATLNERLQNGVRKLFGAEFAAESGAVMVLPTFGQAAALHVVVVGVGGAAVQTVQAVRQALATAIHKAYDWSADEMAVAVPPSTTPGLNGVDFAKAVRAACQDAHQHLQRMDVLVEEGALVAQIETVFASPR